MNTSTLAGLEAFKGIPEETLSSIINKSQLLAYQAGQPISSAQHISDAVLLITEGQARLLGNENGRPVTIQKLNAGDLVGLASLLRAAPCEEVSAASELKGLAIPDEAVLSLYLEEPSFQQWCGRTLFTAELAAVAQLLIERSARKKLETREIIKQLHASARLADSENRADLDNDHMSWLIASGNTLNKQIGDPLQSSDEVSKQGPLPVRLIGVPHQLIEDIEGVTQGRGLGAGQSEQGISAAQDSVRSAPAQPKVSGLDLGQYAAKAKFELIRGDGVIQETQACLQMLATEMDLPFRKDAVERILRDSLKRGKTPNMELCGGLATMLGLHAYGGKVPAETGTRLQVPAMVPWRDGFAVVKESNSRRLVLASPKEGWVELKPEELADAFPDGIELLLVDRSSSTPTQKFGIQWFIPALMRFKGPLLQVLLASFVVQLLGLANPLLIQVIIDKVISQRSLDTLQILGIALVVVTVLGGVLGSLRTFLFTETTNRIDTRLGAEVIDHLLRLPLKYFDNRPVGELGSRIAELEKIRNFLTGQALSTILDAAFSVIYIIVMVIYSWLLTAIALSVVPIQIALTLVGSPLIRRQIRDTAQRNAQTQSHLVEVITGIQTVKAQNVETVSRWKWQDFYHDYIAKTFEKTVTGTALSETSKVLQQVSQLLVLWVGAVLVLDGKLSLGQLIAFRIISGYVTQPLLRLSSIWQSLQELRVSFERLADIIDTGEESSEEDKANIPLPSIHGDVKFSNIVFSFNPNGPKTLNSVNLEIAAGSFVGIVGQSGSGKSTLMKLLPRLYAPNEGRIFIDSYDISKVELYSLRRQVGIVPQDPLLFAGSVSDNIALTDPDASSEEIVQAAKTANAHNFIMDLPMGYSSNVGERGAGLSGGQRQRIAIARTILSKPKLLILDEATSALDYDTERRVCENLRAACKGTTVFFITHRLSTIRNADVIVMMNQGTIAEVGTHDELVAMRGLYYALYRQQEAS